MVDSIKGSGSVAGITPRTESKNPKRTEDSKPHQAVPADTVEISAEALGLSDAEVTATRTRDILKNSGHTLGLDPAFAEKA